VDVLGLHLPAGCLAGFVQSLNALVVVGSQQLALLVGLHILCSAGHAAHLEAGAAAATAATTATPATAEATTAAAAETKAASTTSSASSGSCKRKELLS
jgi:type IV secretory pathway TrbL component